MLTVPADVLAVGPGLGRSPEVTAFVQALVERCGVPIVLDADGLQAFAGQSDRLVGRDGVDVIITPHPGEMASLTGLTIADVQGHRLDVARDFATTHRVHVVLKGHRTTIASPEGRVFINLTGNPGMATGGTGDVLTGTLASWMAQLLDAESAAKLAVYLHGLAGDLAEADEGQTGAHRQRRRRSAGRGGARTDGPAQTAGGAVVVIVHQTHSERETVEAGRELARSADARRGRAARRHARGGEDGVRARTRGRTRRRSRRRLQPHVHDRSGVPRPRRRSSTSILYRLTPAEVDDLALDDLMDDAVLAVEWPDRWLRAPADAVVVTITHTGEDTRQIQIKSSHGAHGEDARSTRGSDG